MTRNIEELQDKYVFTEAECNILKEPYCYENNSSDTIRDPRSYMKVNLLHICEEVERELNEDGIDIHTHWNSKNKTSLIYPCPRNYNKVDWVGVRFGRSEAEIKRISELINLDCDEEDGLAFLKFQNIQVNIRSTGLEIALYHSIPQNTFDRGFLHEHIYDTDVYNTVALAISKLKGLGFKLYTACGELDIDTHTEREFIEFYMSHDIYDTYTSIGITIPMYDIRLLKQNILDTIEFYIESLLPLYDATKWTLKGDQ